MRARGVDVSSVQGHVDWRAFREGGFEFAIVKYSEGATGRDPMRVAHTAGATAAGVLVGTYHFLSPSSPVEEQVENAIAALGGYVPPLGVFVDFEYPLPDAWPEPKSQEGERLAQRCVDFCAGLEARGVKVGGVYTMPYFAEALPFCEALLTVTAYPLWLAWYPHETVAPADEEWPKVPIPWTDWAFWQWSGNKGAHAPGIPQVVDHNLFNGDLRALKKWAGI
jgi:lysozyme